MVPVSSPKRSRVSRSRSGSQVASARSQWVRASRKSPEDADQSEAAAGDAHLDETPRVLRLLQERPSEFARPPLLAPHEGQGPLTVAGREALRQSRRLWPRARAARAKAALVSSAAKPWHHHRLAVGRLEMEPTLALGFRGLDLVGLRKHGQQRLGLAKLGHFGISRLPSLSCGRGVGGEGAGFAGRRKTLIPGPSPQRAFRRTPVIRRAMREKGERREAFERGREDGVGFGGAGGRLIELGERERREQMRTARALLARYRDGGLEALPRRAAGSGGSRLSRISPRRR